MRESYRESGKVKERTIVTIARRQKNPHHGKDKLAPLLFREEGPVTAQALRTKPVAPAQHSPATKKKGGE